MTGPAEETFANQPVGNGYLGTAVSMGNPHLIIFVDDVAKIDLAHIGPILEHLPEFLRRVNVSFIQVVDRQHLIQRTWEQGAGINFGVQHGSFTQVPWPPS